MYGKVLPIILFAMTIDGSLKLSRLRPRYFDEVDTVTGTSEADVFEVEPLKIEKILFPPRTTQTLVDGAIWTLIPPADEEIRVPGRGRAFPKERPQSNEVKPLLKPYPWWLEDDDTREAGQGRVIRKPGQGTAPPKEQPGFETQSLDDNFIAMRIPIIVDESTDSEVDILVYQEKERAVYLDRFQAPTARSYTYIEDFEPIQDEIIVGGNPYMIEIGDNDIPMLADTIRPAFWCYNICFWSI